MYNVYMNTQDTRKERKTKQHNTTQTLRQLFSKGKELHLRCMYMYMYMYI